MVTGTVVATPNVVNSGKTSDFTTNFSIRVALNNAPMTTGTVTLSSSSQKTNLTFNANGNGNGRWTGQANGYDEVYQLDVTDGTDSVTGVRVDGPGIHTISAPTVGASVDSTIANMFTWQREAAADTAVFHADGLDSTGITISDSGSYSIAPATLRADKTQTTPATLALVRTNQVTPAGAVAGSQFSVSVVNSIDVVVLANPNAP